MRDGIYPALQLAKRGWLQRLFTSYPKSLLLRPAPAIPPSQVEAYSPLAIAERVILRIPVLRRRVSSAYWHSLCYEYLVERRLPECDIFSAFSGFAKKCLLAVRKMGALGLVERGSSHILFQRDILADEYARSGIPFRFDPGVVDRELSEYSAADYVVVQSEFAYRTFVEHGVPQRKLIKLGLGVDTDLFQPQPRQDHRFRVLYVGGISLRKGVKYLMRAMEQLNLPDCELVLVGHIEDSVRELMKKHAHRYRHEGFVRQSRLPWLYSQADVLVLPTLEDGFAHVIPEAMACGIPVIATEHSGGPDLIREGVDGFVVPIRDPRAIAERIEWLFMHPQEKRLMGETARQRVREFTWDKYGDRMAEAYQRILTEKNGNSSRPTEPLTSAVSILS
ncbi:MAG: glycosyltransferase family 4 protein [Acidobacteria bacterium]|nr:glycosyltransferase family 4 protein [Acidobacteriota bacterium]